MNIEVKPIDSNIYATGLEVQTDFLSWKTRGCEILLLFQYSFGNRFELNDAFIQALSGAGYEQLTSEDGFPVNQGIARIIPDGLTHDLRIPVRPASYALFAAKMDTASNTLSVYKPTVDDNCCSVSTLIEIRVKRYIPKKPGFRLPFVKYDETPKYQISIPQVFPYDDGSIFYYFAGNDGRNYKYPIVKDMLGKTFLVNERSGFEMKFNTKNSGYQIKLIKTEG